jgi:heavy-metal resistance protein
VAVKRWWLVIVLLLSLGINAGLFAAILVRRMAAPRLPPPAAGQQQGAADQLPRLADRLGLEGDARRRFLERQLRFLEETLRLQLHQREIHRELRHELTGSAPDRARVDQILRGSAATYHALEQALASDVLDTREILSPDQQRQFLQIVRRLRAQGPRVFQGPGQQQRGPLQRRLQRRRDEAPPERGDEPPASDPP